MQQNFEVKRTAGHDKDFQLLISHLDHELWDELKEDQATYDQYNKVPDIKTAVLVYANNHPVACGCFKEYNNDTVEIKRMFVEKEWRGKGLSRTILHHLEQWAISKGYQYAILETSVRFSTALNLYKTSGYNITPNYPPYTGLPESVCMKKELQ